ncbi:MAG: peptide MFS transporter [Prevotellaceae bacterium]|jgi:POT family proton-dependent oligopeptide transporter|nr:peptide MFS transporter [Prevotellaceae bacterium]
MFKNHPKGLIVAFFTNMGERFGFYTMMAILVLFLQAKFGLSESVAGDYYSWFYFAIYALALIGGIVADKTKKYKTVILFGQIIMFAGYAVIAVPGMSLNMTLVGLVIIALGNGFFKGNLQAVVGQLYDNPQYSKQRDNAFMLFYMGINIGAFFAPFIASGIRDWWLEVHGFLHDGSLPSLCHQMINHTLGDTTQLQALANSVIISGQPVVDLKAFAQNYIDVFSRGYNWAFAIAAGAMIVSLLVYLIFNKLLPSKSKEEIASMIKEKTESKKQVNLLQYVVPTVLFGLTTFTFYIIGELLGVKEINYKTGLAVGLFVAFVSYMFLISTKEERPRINALCIVFFVVIFFWMSFHQNGLTLTLFARDYTVKEVGEFTFLFFNLKSILCVIATIGGAVLALSSKNTKRRIVGTVLVLIFGALSYYLTTTYGEKNPISPETFQSFNPLFIVALTPLVMGLFTYLGKRDKDPSTPRKIGLGMIIAAIGFIIVLVASLNLVSPHLLGGAATPDSSRVYPYWLMSSYLVLTIAELCLSPMGLSFVSKVAPSRFQGLMQGGWLLATAVGNKFLFVGSLMWGRIDLYLLWGIFVICCLLSAAFIFLIIKRLEKATK